MKFNLFARKAKDPKKFDANRQQLDKIPETLSAASASLLICTDGILSAFPAATLPILSKEFNIDKVDPWLPFVFYLSMAVLIPFGGFVSSKVGRRRSLLIGVIPILASIIGMSLASTYPILVLFRAIGALGFSLTTPSISVYIAESVHSDHRGVLLSIMTLMESIGAAYTFCFILFASNNWRLLLQIITCVPILSFIFLCRLPESPYWLIEKEMFKEARESLQFFRGKTYNIDGEYNTMVESYESRKNNVESLRNGVKIFFMDFIACYKKIGVLLMIYQWTGAGSLIAFLTSIFESIFPGLTAKDAEKASVAVSISRIFSSGFSLIGMRYIKYRTLFLSCALFATIGCMSLGLFEIVDPLIKNAIFSYLPLVSVIVITFCNVFGVYPVLLATNTEMYPISIKSQAISISQSMSFLSMAGNVMVFPLLKKALSVYEIFWVYGACSAVLGIYGYFVLSNSRGKQLADIQVESKARKISKQSDNETP